MFDVVGLFLMGLHTISFYESAENVSLMGQRHQVDNRHALN